MTARRHNAFEGGGRGSDNLGSFKWVVKRNREKLRPPRKLRSMQVISKMLRSKFSIKNEELPKLDALVQEMFAEFAALSGVKQELKIA